MILASIYSSGQYSDFTITCKGKRFQVHKAIVCPRSGFFAAALRTAFKEACEGIVDLASDGLDIVEIMIHYFTILITNFYHNGVTRTLEPTNWSNHVVCQHMLKFILLQRSILSLVLKLLHSRNSKQRLQSTGKTRSPRSCQRGLCIYYGDGPRIEECCG
ncbi:hypothetical protein V2G26_012781 [Clonostachys chloroleuca]